MKQGILEAYRDRIERGLSRALHGHAPLRALLRYHIGLEDETGAPARATGKWLRPSLVLFVAEQLGGASDVALSSAVGLELIHGFSLIHDDIQDRDRVRRGRPAVWTICGIEQAINAGDLMHTLAIAAALDSSPAAANCLIRATQQMIEGQSQDLDFERRTVTSNEYLTMVDRKTGALLRCAFELGGIAAEAEDRVLATLTALGQAVGRAFQIQDDLLGIWGNDDMLGKATGSDIRRRKKTLPIVQLFEHARGEDAAVLETIYDGDGDRDLPPEDVARVIEHLDALGIRAGCEALVHKHLDEALHRLADLPFDDSAHDRMRELIEFLARRQK